MGRDVCTTKDAPSYFGKEVHFFDKFFDKGPKFYCSKFSSCGKKISMDVTPNYLDFGIAQRMGETFSPSARQEIKLIAILRDPVERMLSWYNHVRAEVALKGEKACQETPYCRKYLRLSYKHKSPNSGIRSADVSIPQGDDLENFIS